MLATYFICTAQEIVAALRFMKADLEKEFRMDCFFIFFLQKEGIAKNLTLKIQPFFTVDICLQMMTMCNNNSSYADC